LFSLVDNLLLRSLPVRDPNRLVDFNVYSRMAGRLNNKPSAGEVSRATFAPVPGPRDSVADVLGSRYPDRPKISLDGVAQPGRAGDLMSTNFFRGLGVPLVVGRYADERDANVIVISERWWRSRFAGSADVLGRAITVDGKSY